MARGLGGVVVIGVLVGGLAGPACDPFAGFGAGDDAGGDGGVVPGTDEGSDCERGCAWLADCELCWPSEGACPTELFCVDLCETEAGGAVAACLNEIASCGDEDAIDACYEEVDLCAAGCAALDACGLCDTDAEGACLTTEACASECQQTGKQGWADCLTEVAACDARAVDACYATLVPDLGDSECARACERLEQCGWCETDEAGDCLAPADCLRACEGGSVAAVACLAGLVLCEDEAIEACYEER